MLAPLGVLLPLALAGAASAWGVERALLLLAAQPIGLAGLALATSAARRSELP
jgi:hypothetical protein